ncbi:MAG: glycosyltransferase [Myxococcota bacterium]|jgi:hypothetical protein|nr:glycosyltransferase [Myxococcota bacterium]
MFEPSDVTVVLPAVERQGEADPWIDLHLALHSLKAYTPAGTRLLVAWKGRIPPIHDEHTEHSYWRPEWRLVPQDPLCINGGAAMDFAIRYADSRLLLITGDDCVFMPDFLERMLEEYNHLSAQGVKVGLLGVRSNYVKGPQNIRYQHDRSVHLGAGGLNFPWEGQLQETDMAVVPIASMLSLRSFYEVGGYPHGNWFTDDVFSWQLRNLGHRNWISRAYVHHVGMRCTGQDNSDELRRKGIAWLQEEHPQFLVDLARKRAIREAAQAGNGAAAQP